MVQERDQERGGDSHKMFRGGVLKKEVENNLKLRKWEIRYMQEERPHQH